LACITLQSLYVNLPEQFGGILAANQRFKYMPQGVVGRERCWNLGAFGLYSPFILCGPMPPFGGG
jgi:hypothetical protein